MALQAPGSGDVKSMFASRTFWVNLIVGALGLVDSLGIVNLVPAPWDQAIVPVLAAVNLWLRSVTTQPVSLTGRPATS